MLVVVEGALHVCKGLQSSEGGQPPQVPPQPSLPQVFPEQFGAHAEAPPSTGAPEEAPAADPLDIVLPESFPERPESGPASGGV